MILLLGTKNAGKIRELKVLLSDLPGVSFLTSDERPFSPVEETGNTFEENALLKARAICAETGLPVLAEDSGLEVNALDGAPGVYSARYSGEPVDYARNNALLLKKMAGVDDRSARFVDVAVLRFPDGREYVRKGILTGRIATAPRGKGGFGYDPLFIPDGYDKTLAELGAEEKNRISHRARAIAAIKEVLRSLLAEGGSAAARGGGGAVRR